MFLINLLRRLFSKFESTKKEEEMVAPSKIIMGFTRRENAFPLSKVGQERLSQLHPLLQKVVSEYLFYKDLSITEGYRSKEKQEEYRKAGTSKAAFGQSPHNYLPSIAVDIYPYPAPAVVKRGKKVIDDNSKEWDIQAQLFLTIAKELGVEVEWGGSWKTLVDKPHFQLGSNNNWRKYLA